MQCVCSVTLSEAGEIDLYFSLMSNDRLDIQASDLKKKLNQMNASQKLPKEEHDNAYEMTTKATIEVSIELVLR